MIVQPNTLTAVKLLAVQGLAAFSSRGMVLATPLPAQTQQFPASTQFQASCHTYFSHKQSLGNPLLLPSRAAAISVSSTLDAVLDAMNGNDSDHAEPLDSTLPQPLDNLLPQPLMKDTLPPALTTATNTAVTIHNATPLVFAVTLRGARPTAVLVDSAPCDSPAVPQ